jgi:hypothetical protein
VEEDLLLSAQLPNLLHRLDDANLVVDLHYAHQCRLGPDGVFEPFQIDEAAARYGQIGDVVTLLL